MASQEMGVEEKIGEGMNGEGMNVEGMNGEGMNGEGMNGEGMNGEEMKKKRSMDRVRDQRMTKKGKENFKFSDRKIEENSSKKLQQIKIVQKNKGLKYMDSYEELLNFIENLLLTQKETDQVKKINSDLKKEIQIINNKFKVQQDDSDLMLAKERNYRTWIIATTDPLDINLEVVVQKKDEPEESFAMIHATERSVSKVPASESIASLVPATERGVSMIPTTERIGSMFPATESSVSMISVMSGSMFPAPEMRGSMVPEGSVSDASDKGKSVVMINSGNSFNINNLDETGNILPNGEDGEPKLGRFVYTLSCEHIADSEFDFL